MPTFCCEMILIQTWTEHFGVVKESMKKSVSEVETKSIRVQGMNVLTNNEQFQ